jgi:tRNA threonylcarbamoyladenosine biosynthesis protein TsaE
MPIVIKSDKIDLNSEENTEQLAYKFSKKIKPGDVVFFFGEIGVGKTTFIRYLINNFQRENKLEPTEVPSPTFNLLNEYQIKDIKIHHYDLFRIKSVDEIKNLGLFQEIKKTIVLIEWPQIINEIPKNLIELVFEYKNDHQKRSVQVKGLNL